MKYFNIHNINLSIRLIREGTNTNEHITGRAGSLLVAHYFPYQKFAVTSEQIQESTNKRPDLAIEEYIPKSEKYIPRCFVEFKSLVGVSMEKIPDQLHDTLFMTIDHLGITSDKFSMFMIAMKGTKIAFYMYHSFSTLLEEYAIVNYKGFIPLNYRISRELYYKYVENTPGYALQENIYNRYESRISGFTTDHDTLEAMGASATNKINHPHILDLLDQRHREDIHNLFKFISECDPSTVLL